MNLSIAKEILDLPDDFTPEMVKENYHKLSLKNHPDKGGDSSEFIKIKQAREFITNFKNEKPEKFNLNFNLNNIFRTMLNVKSKSIFGFKKEIEIILTPKEFLQGTIKEIETTFKTHCSCEQMFCYACKGFSFNQCTECLGSGIIQQCDDCINGFIKTTKKVKIVIPKNQLNDIIFENTIIHLKLTHGQLIENKLYFKFNITLKESLTGFVKTFKDPFGDIHTISIKNTIIKQNDGYTLTNFNLTLLFNVIYPKKLKKDTKQIIQNLQF